jgi:hypothetical protein
VAQHRRAFVLWTTLLATNHIVPRCRAGCKHLLLKLDTVWPEGNGSGPLPALQRWRPCGRHRVDQDWVSVVNTSQHQSTPVNISQHQSTSVNISQRAGTLPALLRWRPCGRHRVDQDWVSAVNTSQHQSTSVNISQHQSTSVNISQHQSTGRDPPCTAALAAMWTTPRGPRLGQCCQHQSTSVNISQHQSTSVNGPGPSLHCCAGGHAGATAWIRTGSVLSTPVNTSQHQSTSVNISQHAT